MLIVSGCKKCGKDPFNRAPGYLGYAGLCVDCARDTTAGMELVNSARDRNDAIERLYRHRDILDTSDITITGKQIREIIAELEAARSNNESIFAQLIEMGIKGIVIEAKPKQPDETPRYVYALFVSAE